MVIGGRNISTTASLLVSGRGGAGAIAMAGAVIASMGTTVGVAASGVVENGEIVNSVVIGVMTVPVVNGMSVAAAGSAGAVGAAGTVDKVARDADAVAIMAITAGVGTNS